MADKYKINPDGSIVFLDRKESKELSEHDKLMAEFADLEHQVVSSIAHKTNDPEKIARYHELKKILEIPDASDPFESDAFKQATQKLQSKIDKENNADLWNAVQKFKGKQNG